MSSKKTISLYLNSILIENYRLFHYLKINFNSNFTIIKGRNGSGKTTIVNSINLLKNNNSFKKSDITINNIKTLTDLTPKLTFSLIGTDKSSNNEIILSLDYKNQIKVESNPFSEYSNEDLLRFFQEDFPMIIINSNSIYSKMDENDKMLSGGQRTLKILTNELKSLNKLENGLIIFDDIDLPLDDYSYFDILQQIIKLCENNQIILTFSRQNQDFFGLLNVDYTIFNLTDRNYLITAINDNTNFYDIFTENITNIHNLINNSSFNDEVNQLILKMSFLHLITCLETYLSDALIQTVKGNAKFQKRVIETDPVFEKETRSVKNLFQMFENIEDFIIRHLSSLLYHNLAKISNIYRSVLKISFPDDLSIIFKAIDIRHDLVHRNGRSITGDRIIIKREDIGVLSNEIVNLVNHIDSRLIIMLKLANL